MKRIYLFILVACALCFSAQAQEERRGPDLQTIEGDFFDPTRQVKKKEVYSFHVEYRLEAGYVQGNQQSKTKTYPNMYLHGIRLGGTFDFMLPYRFSVQTGLLYTLTYGKNEQHWAQMSTEDIYAHTNVVRHRVLEHQLTIPVRAYYNIHLWKNLNMFFYGGPQLHIGLAATDYMQNDLTPLTTQWLQQQSIQTEKYDRYTTQELWRANIQLGVGGGFEWDKYRLQAGYDFGLNNQIRNKLTDNRHMWEWSWYVSFSYRL